MKILKTWKIHPISSSDTIKKEDEQKDEKLFMNKMDDTLKKSDEESTAKLPPLFFKPSQFQRGLNFLTENPTNENIKIMSSPKIVKPTKLYKIKKYLIHLLTLMFCFCFHRSRNQVIQKLKTKNYSSSILNFFKHLIWILRAINNFRSATIYRNLNRVNEFHLYLINDATYYKKEESQDNKAIMKFFSNPSIRKLFRVSKKKFKVVWNIITKVRGFIKKHLKYIEQKIPVITPNQKFKLLWDLLIIFIIYIYFFIIPMQLSFDFFYDDEFEKICEENGMNNKLSKFIILIPEVILIMDTLLKFITGIYVNGVIVTQKNIIIEHYLKKGLIYDLLAYFPIILQGILRKNFDTPDFVNTLIKIFQLLIFFKFNRVAIALSNFQEIISSKGKNDYILGGFCTFLTIIFITHINACVWHAIAYFNTKDEITWLVTSGLSQTVWIKKYWIAMYWSVSIFSKVGLGDKFTPQNNIEYIFGFVSIVVAMWIFCYALFSVQEIYKMMSSDRKQYKEMIRVINGYMKNKSIGFELQSKVRNYLEYIIQKDTSKQDEIKILEKLNKALKKEVIMEAYGKILSQTGLFKKNFSVSTIENLSFCLKQLTFSPEEFIYKAKSRDENSIYILEKGIIEEITEHSKGDINTTIKTIKPGEVFGSYSFFSDEPRETSVLSKGFSSVFEIKKNDFLNIVKENLEDYQSYCCIRDQIKLYKNFKNLHDCSSCKSKNHIITNCPIIHYQPDRDLIIKRYCYTTNQIIRGPPNTHRKLKRFNARVIKAQIQKKSKKMTCESESESFDSLLSCENDIKESTIKSFKDEDLTKFDNINKNNLILLNSNENEFLKALPSPKNKCNINFNSQVQELNSCNDVECSPGDNKFIKTKTPKEQENADDGTEKIKPNKNSRKIAFEEIDKKFFKNTENMVYHKEKRQSCLDEKNNGELFNFEFENSANYTRYFKNNNLDNVMQKIMEKRKSRKKIHRKLIKNKVI